MIEEFIREMGRYVPAEARIMFCQFRGDPNEDIYEKWRAKVLKYADNLDPKANCYVCVSAMKKNDRGEFRRRKENFAGGLLLMIDDLGDGAGAKFPLSTIDCLPPTALVETSPNNFQAIYMFDSLVEDMDEFDALIRAFIQKKFLEQDTGMAGVNRVFRPPFGVNGKEKYNGWKVRGVSFEPKNRYSVATIAAAFGLELTRKVKRPPVINRNEYISRIQGFENTVSLLESAGMLKKHTPDVSGWVPIKCPWTHEHSNQADTGAAIRMPDEENGYYGAFRCHHGHCAGKGWSSLTQWMSDEAEDLLNMINAEAAQDGFVPFVR